MNRLTKRLAPLLAKHYPDDHEQLLADLLSLAEKWRPRVAQAQMPGPDETTSYLITYADTVRRPGQTPLATLTDLLTGTLDGLLTDVHLLPTLFPWSSDDGFAVTDYRTINPEVGDLDDVARLAARRHLCFDLVANHTSAESAWFSGWLAGDSRYAGFYLDRREGLDVSRVSRPRTTPLFHPFTRPDGTEVRAWTTFSADQVDLDVRTPAVLLELTDVLLGYVAAGARTIRLDAVAFLWKDSGTSCLHRPGTHAVIRIWRALLADLAHGVRLLTETNVGHKENVSYFGDGRDEAHMVYQFALPPLVLHSFVAGDTAALSQWAHAAGPRPRGGVWFNFLASHDGIGMKPVENLLDDTERTAMADRVLSHGGYVGMGVRSNGSPRVYELNLAYADALCTPAELADPALVAAKTLAAHAIMCSLAGIPAIYLNALLGSPSDLEAARETGIRRRVNRQVLDADRLEEELRTDERRRLVLAGMRRLLTTRRGCPELHPQARQHVLELDSRVFAVTRTSAEGDRLFCVANVSGDSVHLPGFAGVDALTGESTPPGGLRLPGYGYAWLRPRV